MSDALRLELVLADLRRKYAEDQPRDDHGRFADGGGGNDATPIPESKWGEFSDRNQRAYDDAYNSDDPDRQAMASAAEGYSGGGYEHDQQRAPCSGGTEHRRTGRCIDRRRSGGPRQIVENAIAQSFDHTQDLSLFPRIPWRRRRWLRCFLEARRDAHGAGVRVDIARPRRSRQFRRQWIPVTAASSRSMCRRG
jgi:hypothetical protein